MNLLLATATTSASTTCNNCEQRIQITMRILVGNNHLVKTGGTENYTYALALELKRQGHSVEYFTFEKGEVSFLLEENGIPFKSQKQYDLILANHNTVVEELRLLGYIIQTCHGYIPQLEQPSPFADAYVAVSEEVREYLQVKGYQSTVILNGIDCNRFCSKTPVSEKLSTVLSLCQSDVANDFIGRCCEQAGIKFLQSNKFTDNVWSIEDLINQSDLVIGLGRSAYDAMACGRCVLVYDYREYMGEFLGDGILTPDSVGKSIFCNCSGRWSRLKFDEQAFIEEMQKYSPKLAAWSREYAVENLNIEKAAKVYLDLCSNKKKNALKLLLKKRIYEERQEKDNIVYMNQQLREQIVSLLQQIEQLQTAYSAKHRKHLRAIRALVWLCIALLIISVIFCMKAITLNVK